MLGLKKENDHYIFEAAVRTEQLFLNLYHKNRRVRQIAFDPADRIGDVWHLELPVTSAIPLTELSYCYEADGRIFTDPNGTVFEGRKSFGNLKDGTRTLKTPIGEATAIPESSEAWRDRKSVV